MYELTRRQALLAGGAFTLASLSLPKFLSAQAERVPGGPVGDIEAIAPDWPEMIELFRLLIPNWEKLGVTVKAQHATLNTVFALTAGEHNAPHLTAEGWGGAPDRIDPDFFMTEFFNSRRLEKGGLNYGNYNSPEFDKLNNAQRQEMDPKKRVELIHQAQQLLLEDRPGVSIYYRDYVNPYRKDRIKGVVPVLGNGVGLAYIPWTYYMAEPIGERDFVRVTTQYDIATLNPFATGEVVNASFLRFMYAPLVMRGPDLEPTPWTAESWEVIDSTTVDVTLREGLKFHDGEPVKVEDLKFTFDFIAKHQFASYARFNEHVASVEIVGDRTARFKLKQPYAPFVPNILGYAFIAPKHIWEEVEKDTSLGSPADWPNDNPVGYGPYRYGIWKKEEYFQFDANPEWFMPPNFSSMYWLIVPNIDSQIGMLEAGDSDIMAWSLTPSQIKQLQANPNIGVGSAPSHAPREIRYNLALPPFDDVVFRKAFAISIDREQLVNTLVDGAATLGDDTFLSTELPESDPSLTIPEFDIDKARAMLEEAGYTWDDDGRLHYPA
ncbi:MAG: ABC transporter substrate-binding protein [Rhodovibrionaceae bacterium]